MNENLNENSKENNKLLISIVKKGFGKKVVEATKKAGAKGGTIFLGKGTGTHDKKNIFGIVVESEREIILTLISEEKINDIITAVTVAGQLEKPGFGNAFVVDVKKIVGITHLLKLKFREV